jgi:hypothetical protein
LANANVGAGDRLLVTDLRNTLYFLQVPFFHAQPEYQSVVPLATAAPAEVWAALQRQRITAWLSRDEAPSPLNGLASLEALAAARCARQAAVTEGAVTASRSAPAWQAAHYRLWKLTPQTCAFSTDKPAQPG